MVEVVKSGAGSEWLIGEAVALAKAKGATCVVLDGAGPAANKIDEIEKGLAGRCPVRAFTTDEMANAWSDVYDAVFSGQLRHKGQLEVAAALKQAVQIPVGDRWKAGRRKSEGDITCGEVVAMAYEGLKLYPGGAGILW
jgi:hypothetical protein